MLPRNNRKVVFSNGCFDLLHASHVASLRYAKSLGDILIVGVNSDESIQRLKGIRRPIIPLEQRLKMLEALECVDYLIPFDTDSPIDLVKYIKPDVMVKGQEYEGVPMRSSAHAGETIFFPMQEGVSTSRIIERVLDHYSPPF
jgi:D-beta-D-heptose 7-phosphate kinase/D-beta-D-heptose 1-phosphate adenosyltransferase